MCTSGDKYSQLPTWLAYSHIGTPGVGESFVGTEKSEASKEGRLFISVFKKYASSKTVIEVFFNLHLIL